MEAKQKIDLQWQPNHSPSRKGFGTITAKRGDESLEIEQLNILQPKSRDGFTDNLCKRYPEIDGDDLRRKMLGIASDERDRDKPQQHARDIEIDLSRIIRPERFITRSVSGLTIPVFSESDNSIAGKWITYVQWSDGRRQKIELPKIIDVSSIERFWIQPKPALLTPGDAKTLCGWSEKSRRAWLDGNSAPNPAVVFDRLIKQIDYFIDLPSDRAYGITVVLGLWTLLSYVYPAWDAVPYLYVGGPMGSGKSRVFEILSRLVFRPLGSSNLTGPAMFRTLHDRGGVLLLDEAERLRHAQSPEIADINSLLLAGYKRGGQAIRLQTIGDDYKTTCFDVYGPKALACIAGLPPALASRCIRLMMFRAGDDSPKPRHRIDADPSKWCDLRDDLHALALHNGPIWMELAQRVDVCPNMTGRNFELWQPIISLADWMEQSGVEGLRDVVQSFALESIAAEKETQNPDNDVIILTVLADLIQNGATPTPAEILQRAQEIDPEGFKRWQPRTISDKLHSYGVPRPNKSGDRRVYRNVSIELLRQIQDRYGMDLSIKPAQSLPGMDAGNASQSSASSQSPRYGLPDIED